MTNNKSTTDSSSASDFSSAEEQLPKNTGNNSVTIALEAPASSTIRRRKKIKKQVSKALIGTIQTLRSGQDEKRQARRHYVYHPTHQWFEPPMSAWIPEHNREILLFLIIYNTLVPLLAYHSNFCGDEHVDETSGKVIFHACSDDYYLLEDKVLTGFAVGLFLLLAFRANQAYDRFWEGRKCWGRMKEVSRDFTRLVCTHVRVDTNEDYEDRRRVINFVTAFAAAVKLHLRKERDIQRDLKALDVDLTYQDVANIQSASHMPLFCQDIMSDYLAKQYRSGKLTDFQMATINSDCLAVMSDKLGSCERLTNTPIPLSYVLQLRFFLMLWLLLYPLHIVPFYGWWSILLTNLVSYAVLGIESMACEIEDPFGYSRNDLDLDGYVEGFYKDTQEILSRAEYEERKNIFDRKSVWLLSRSYDPALDTIESESAESSEGSEEDC